MPEDPKIEAIVSLHEWNVAKDKRIAELEEAAMAYRDLSLCYRIGKQPSEKLFNRLEKAKALIEAIDAARKERG